MSTTTLSNPKTNGGRAANGDGRRRPRRTPKGRQVDPTALDEVCALLGDALAPARSADRASASDPGPLRPSLGRASRRARRRDEARAGRGLRGRDLLRAFRRGEGRRDAAAAGHGARVRFAVLRHARRRASAAAIFRASSGANVRVVRAPCMGACDRAPVCAVGHMQVFNATPDKVASTAKAPPHPHAFATPNDLARYRADGGYALLGDCLAGKRTRDDLIKIVSDAGLRGLGGAGFPTGRKWSLVRAEPAPRLFAVNCRRGRARHVQGPLLPRAGSASLHRRHADRRLGGRGARHLHLCARRISRGAAAARRGIREGRARPGSPRTRGCICAAAPAPTSAAKSPR